MYSSLRETLLVASFTVSLTLLPTLTRNDARSAGQQTSAVPATCTSRSRLAGLGEGGAARISEQCPFSLWGNSRALGGSTAAKTRLWQSMEAAHSNRVPAAMAMGAMLIGICRRFPSNNYKRPARRQIPRFAHPPFFNKPIVVDIWP